MNRLLLTLLHFLLVVVALRAQTTILDFETVETTTTFQYFGSTIDGSLNAVVPNPDATGINTSANVANFVKPAVAEVWAGAFSNPNPVALVDLATNNRISVNVYMDHIGSLSLKLEQSTTGGDNWVITVPNTKVNEWETLVFDAAIPSTEAPNTPASGHVYQRVVLFFDFGTAGTGTDQVYYFDDILTLPPPQFTTILDFETVETSTAFQYFGSALDGTFTTIVANPNPSGVNTSSFVTEYIKPGVSEVWAGAFSNPNPVALIDLTTNNRISVNVYMDHIGSLSLKLEQSTTGGDNWVITVPNTKVNEWETLVFDAAIPSIEAPNTSASGQVYQRVVLFFDFGTAGTGTDQVYYFDDILTLAPPPQITTILDFETVETSTGFQYFGSALDGTFTTIVANPNPAGDNTSSFVAEYIKPGVAEVWAGAFSNPNPTTPITLDAGSELCIKVLMDHIGSLALKLEGGTSGQPNWVTQVANTRVNEWEEICFDPTAPSIEGPFEAASGTYERVVLFFDFGTAGTGTDVTYHFDDLVVKSTGAPEVRTVNFRVDMNNYSGNFDQVYVSGSFNNWSGDANPLSDADFDGIWEGTIEVINGAYEYKFTLDNWAAQEQFEGFEECTKRDPSGQFVNRLLLVSGDTDVPEFCFNSCYACGEEVSITFRLGMGSVTPSPDGIWLAGGGNFDVPGGKFQMSDDDLDGIYEITVPRARGFSSYYTFTNGNCPDYSCKEDLTGLPCGDPNNFNDRFLPAVQENTEVATCFGTCFTNAECTTGGETLVSDEFIFTLAGNPSPGGISYLTFGDHVRLEKSITITNTLGQVVDQIRLGEFIQTYTLQTQYLTTGIYFITVRAGDKYYTRKLVM
ncbi:MAG: T9SS type A sorting domain-containing protein [Bacteroidota bacterium]|nr:T9SS type A sorting domain-containing protein [Bacteroidota bacterium]